ncbi:MAG: MBL fold metallo-hydrolase [Candidatus Buchananbacteria bacterium]|nr:MBL fold metallo-hydrolase [Candidatus Buchananbacteria bacterium]
MQIQWLGQSCFKIQTKNNGEEITIVTDPYDGDDIGLKPLKLQADIVTVSHDHSDHNNLDAIKNDSFIISTPGEYETKGVFIYGFPAYHDNKEGKEKGNITIFKINAENISLAHLSDLGHDLNDELLDKIGNIDILFLPIGGTFTIDAKKAAEVVSAIEPRIVIPMHYKIPNLKVKLNSIDDFLKESGLPSEKMDKLKITKKDLPQEETKIIILNP